MGEICLQEQSSPTSGVTDKVLIYPKSGGGLYKMADDDTEHVIITSGSTGVTDTYIPYSNSGVFADSPLTTDGSSVTASGGVIVSGGATVSSGVSIGGSILTNKELNVGGGVTVVSGVSVGGNILTNSDLNVGGEVNVSGGVTMLSGVTISKAGVTASVVSGVSINTTKLTATKLTNANESGYTLPYLTASGKGFATGQVANPASGVTKVEAGYFGFTAVHFVAAWVGTTNASNVTEAVVIVTTSKGSLFPSAGVSRVYFRSYLGGDPMAKAASIQYFAIGA
jgi:hypothetical protein